jgi:hypothetical protein
MTEQCSSHLSSKVELSRFNFVSLTGEQLAHDPCGHDSLQKMPCVWISIRFPQVPSHGLCSTYLK